MKSERHGLERAAGVRSAYLRRRWPIRLAPSGQDYASPFMRVFGLRSRPTAS